MRALTSRVVVLVAALALGACASSPPKVNGSADAQTVADYSGPDYAEDYALQAGLGGLLIGAGAGCAIGEIFFDSCITGAAIGGVVGGASGAVFGWVQGQITEDYAIEAANAEEALSKAGIELSEARKARKAATNEVSARQTELRQLSERYKAGLVDREQYQNRVNQAKAMQAYIGGSTKRLEDVIESVDEHIDEEQDRNPTAVAALEGRKRELETELTQLNQQLSVLVSEVDTAEETLSS